MHPNIILAGFMGTGKSTVGRILAARLGWLFVDTDALITARAGCSIADIFAQQGEAAFRALEAACCQHAAAHCHQVIALGGGALLHPATDARLRQRGLVVCLMADLATISARVGEDPARPLFSADRAELAALYAARAAHYAALPHHVDTTRRTADDVAGEIVQLWQNHRQPPMTD